LTIFLELLYEAFRQVQANKLLGKRYRRKSRKFRLI